MRRQAIMVLAAALLGGMGLVVAGCGSKGGSNAPMSNAAPASATSTTTASTTTTPNPSSLGLACSRRRTAARSSASRRRFATALTGAGQDLAKTAELMKSFADQTPSEIRPDFQVLADAYAKVAAALKGVDLSSGKAPSADVIAKLSKLSSQIDTAKVSQASTNISTWATKNCKPK